MVLKQSEIMIIMMNAYSVKAYLKIEQVAKNLIF